MDDLLVTFCEIVEVPCIGVCADELLVETDAQVIQCCEP